jgi:hypothetical protein
MINHLLKSTFIVGAVTALLGGAFYGCDRYHRGGIGEECYRDGACAFSLACENLSPGYRTPEFKCMSKKESR